MKLLIQLIVIIAAGVALAMIVREDPGYVMFSYQGTNVETSFAIFIVAAIAAIFVSYLLIRLFGSLFFAPRRVRKWQDRRRDRVANTALTRGLLAQAEGKWRQSEKALLTYAKKSESAINYLAAAKSAQALGANERVNQYLDLAQATDPNASSAIRITQAELLIDSGQPERAAAALERIRTEDPKNGRALLLMTKLYKSTKNWPKLCELLYDLKRNRVIQHQEYNQLERLVHSELLKRACESENMVQVNNSWSIIPKYLHNDSEFVAIYARKLLEENLHDDAEPLLRMAIRHHWNEELVYLYGLLYSENPYGELTVAEKWYKQHQDNPVLLLTLGRLSSRSELWGKARSYLETSVENGGGAEAYHALAQVLEHIDEPELAAKTYRQGLEIASGKKGLPELAELTAKKKARQNALAQKEAEKAEQDAKEEAELLALEDQSKEERVAASAA